MSLAMRHLLSILALAPVLLALACSDGEPQAPSQPAGGAGGAGQGGGPGGFGGGPDGGCSPGETRCDPEEPGARLTCDAGGEGWTKTACAEGQSCSGGACVDLCAAAAEARSYQGCEYWPASIGNARSAIFKNDMPFVVALANLHASPVSATVEGGALSEPVTRTLPAGEVSVIELPKVEELAATIDSGLRPKAAYRVRTSAPVTAYQFSPSGGSTSDGGQTVNDASLLLPTPVLSTRYSALAYTDATVPNTSIVYGSLVTVIGTQETPTSVKVTLSGAIRPGEGVPAGSAGSQLDFTLGAGDVVQFVGNGSGDLTGTLVEASAPVVVYSGHVGAQIPVNTGGADHIEEQLFPEETWGKSYAAAPLPILPSVTPVYRVLAREAGTTLTFDPPSVHPGATLGAREHLEFRTGEAFTVTASQPVLVGQYMPSPDDPSGTEQSYPSFTLLVPREQYRAEFAFHVHATYPKSALNLITFGQTKPTLDGTPVSGSGAPIGQSGLNLWTIPVSPGAHRLKSDPAALNVYGIAEVTTYAYPGGLDLKAIVPK